tara:strand:+ start:401 stop:628 length:228 start_codon:yes stop_codon:yes gene_type:complete
MTPLEIAQKYVYGEHDALTDNQEIIDMTKDIEQAIAEQLTLTDVGKCDCDKHIACIVCGEEKGLDGVFWKRMKEQ